MKEWIVSYQFNSLIALYTYWVPMVVCVVVYLCRFVREYREDIKKSSETYYTPTLTVGLIVWRIAIATLPAVNIFAMVFDCAASVFRWLAKVLDMPLVPKRKS